MFIAVKYGWAAIWGGSDDSSFAFTKQNCLPCIMSNTFIFYSGQESATKMVNLFHPFLSLPACCRLIYSSFFLNVMIKRQ